MFIQKIVKRITEFHHPEKILLNFLIEFLPIFLNSKVRFLQKLTHTIFFTTF